MNPSVANHIEDILQLQDANNHLIMALEEVMEREACGVFTSGKEVDHVIFHLLKTLFDVISGKIQSETSTNKSTSTCLYMICQEIEKEATFGLFL